jgi:hypothetical protein
MVPASGRWVALGHPYQRAGRLVAPVGPGGVLGELALDLGLQVGAGQLRQRLT